VIPEAISLAICFWYDKVRPSKLKTETCNKLD
jgi:hypothetical protein